MSAFLDWIRERMLKFNAWIRFSIKLEGELGRRDTPPQNRVAP